MGNKNITSHHHLKLNNTVPTWLWFSLHDLAEPKRRWNDEKEKLAQSIIKSLREKGRFHCWPEEVLNKVLHINQHDALPIFAR